MATLRKSTLPDDLRNGLRAYITSRSGLYFRDHDLGNLDGALGERMTAHGFELGAASYLTLLNAERRHQQARIVLVQAQAARFSDTAALFQALGGGWWKGADPQ